VQLRSLGSYVDFQTVHQLLPVLLAMSTGEDSLNCGHQHACCSSADGVNKESHDRVILTGKTEKNLSQCLSAHHKSHMD
jgi:hypothetical protein